MLSDRTIRQLVERGDVLSIKSHDDEGWPIQPEQWQPASVDLRLGSVVGAMHARGDNYEALPAWVIPPRTFCLGSTIEVVTLGRDLCGRVEGKSSWARRGLMIHCAGFVDPGFSGELTLEMFNLSEHSIHVRAGKRIAQICFDWLDKTPLSQYGDPGLRSRYQGQAGPTPARDWVTDIGVAHP